MIISPRTWIASHNKIDIDSTVFTIEGYSIFYISILVTLSLPMSLRHVTDALPITGRDEGVSARTMIDGILACDRQGIGDMP